MVQHASKLTLRRLGNELKEKASKTHRGDLSRNGQAGEHLLQANSISLKAYQTCVWGPNDLRKRDAKKAKECLEARRLREANESFTNAMRSSLEEKARQRRSGEIVRNFYFHLQSTLSYILDVNWHLPLLTLTDAFLKKEREIIHAFLLYLGP